jgi:hypothetical protein
MDGTNVRPGIEPRRTGRRLPATTMPSLFDLDEPLERSLRSRHRGDAWLGEVEAKLHAYRAGLQRHVVVTEGEHGWFAELRDGEPRVEPIVRRAQAEVAQLDHLVITLLAGLRHPGRTTREIRHDLLRLVQATRRHRERCQRLVHEALIVELGVG